MKWTKRLLAILRGLHRKLRAHLFSFMLGALLMRGLPMLVLSAQWSLSASLGIPQGELFGLCILLLGGMLVFSLRDGYKIGATASSCMTAGCYAAAAIALNLSAAGRTPAVLFPILADCLIIIVSLLLPDIHHKRLPLQSLTIILLLMLLPLAAVVILSADDRIHTVFQPLAAAGMIATTVDRLAHTDSICRGAMLSGILVVVLLDILL